MSGICKQSTQKSKSLCLLGSFMCISIVIVAFQINVSINVMFSVINDRQARLAMLAGGSGAGCGGVQVADYPQDSKHLYSLLEGYMKIHVLVFLVDVWYIYSSVYISALTSVKRPFYFVSKDNFFIYILHHCS